MLVMLMVLALSVYPLVEMPTEAECWEPAERVHFDSYWIEYEGFDVRTLMDELWIHYDAGADYITPGELIEILKEAGVLT